MELFFASAGFATFLIIIFNISLVFAISLLLSRITIIFGELMLFALLALWSLWDIAAHNGVFQALSSTDPLFYKLPLMILFLAIIFAANHYRISKQPILKAEKKLSWDVRYRFYQVLKIAIGYSIIVALLSPFLPTFLPGVVLVGAATAAVYWDKLRLLLHL